MIRLYLTDGVKKYTFSANVQVEGLDRGARFDSDRLEVAQNTFRSRRRWREKIKKIKMHVGFRSCVHEHMCDLVCLVSKLSL